MTELSNDRPVSSAGRPATGRQLPGTERPPAAADRRLPQFRCTGCGYGASCRIAPERCPMCGGATWEHAGPQWLPDRDQSPITNERDGGSDA
jgi:hypothetical protein